MRIVVVVLFSGYSLFMLSRLDVDWNPSPWNNDVVATFPFDRDQDGHIDTILAEMTPQDGRVGLRADDIRTGDTMWKAMCDVGDRPIDFAHENESNSIVVGTYVAPMPTKEKEEVAKQQHAVLTAHDARTGSVRWKRKLPGVFNRPRENVREHAGLYILSHKGLVFASASVGRSQYLYAVDGVSGNIKWKRKLARDKSPAWAKIKWDHPAIWWLYQDQIFARAIFARAAHGTVLNAATGEEVATETPMPVVSQMYPHPTGPVSYNSGRDAIAKWSNKASSRSTLLGLFELVTLLSSNHIRDGVPLFLHKDTLIFAASSTEHEGRFLAGISLKRRALTFLYPVEDGYRIEDGYYRSCVEEHNIQCKTVESRFVPIVIKHRELSPNLMKLIILDLATGRPHWQSKALSRDYDVRGISIHRDGSTYLLNVRGPLEGEDHPLFLVLDGNTGLFRRAFRLHHETPRWGAKKEIWIKPIRPHQLQDSHYYGHHRDVIWAIDLATGRFTFKSSSRLSLQDAMGQAVELLAPFPKTLAVDTHTDGSRGGTRLDRVKANASVARLPAKQAPKQRARDVSRKMRKRSALVAPRQQSRASSAKEMPKVVMFSTSQCSSCKVARQYFRQTGVRYVELDVDHNQFATQKMVEIQRARGMEVGKVPLIIIGDQVYPSFDQQQIDAELAHFQEQRSTD